MLIWPKPFDRDTWSSLSLVTVLCEKTILYRYDTYTFSFSMINAYVWNKHFLQICLIELQEKKEEKADIIYVYVLQKEEELK